MNNEMTSYQKATKIYIQFMAITVLILSTIFINKILSKEHSINTPFFLSLIVLVVISILGFLTAGKIASKFGKTHYNENMKKWDFWMLPTIVLLFFSFIISPVIDGFTQIKHNEIGIFLLQGFLDEILKCVAFFNVQ